MIDDLFLSATNKKTIADFEQWFYEKQLAA